MKTFFLLSAVALLPVVLSTLIYLAEKTKAISKIPYAVKQIIIGILFGGLAILGTEFGVKTDGAIINARDASPICAGLLFGAPAGIIAGVMGGVERWFAVLGGAGEYPRLACSISTVLAGVFAAVLRKYMFDDKKPKWYYCLATATITEVIHILKDKTKADDIAGTNDRRIIGNRANRMACALLHTPKAGFTYAICEEKTRRQGKKYMPSTSLPEIQQNNT